MLVARCKPCSLVDLVKFNQGMIVSSYIIFLPSTGCNRLPSLACPVLISVTAAPAVEECSRSSLLSLRSRAWPLANANNTSCDELLDLGADARVLHVLAESRRVGLGLLQDGLHDWVLHNGHDLRQGQLGVSTAKGLL